MAEILGLGMSHYPGFIQHDSEMAMRIKLTLQGEKLPSALKDPRNWPERMRTRSLAAGATAALEAYGRCGPMARTAQSSSAKTAR